jgi:very-short-patch-repair endonuclease
MKTFSKCRNEKISLALKGRHNSPSTEFKKGHPRSRPIGIHPSEETKRKISATLKEKIKNGSFPYGFKKGYVPRNKGKHSWENKLIECACGCGQQLKERDCRGRIRKYIRGHNHNQMLGRHHSNEAKKKLRELRLKQKIPQKDTIIETKVQNALKQKGIDFKTHVPVCDICQPDIVIPEKRVVVQCDGDYWHNLPEVKQRDRQQDQTLVENGWTVLRFWEHEIEQNLDFVISRIMEELI